MKWHEKLLASGRHPSFITSLQEGYWHACPPSVSPRKWHEMTIYWTWQRQIRTWPKHGYNLTWQGHAWDTTETRPKHDSIMRGTWSGQWGHHYRPRANQTETRPDMTQTWEIHDHETTCKRASEQTDTWPRHDPDISGTLPGENFPAACYCYWGKTCWKNSLALLATFTGCTSQDWWTLGTVSMGVLIFVRGGLSVLSPSWCTKGRKKSDREHNISEFSCWIRCLQITWIDECSNNTLESGPRLIILFLLGISATFDTPWNVVASRDPQLASKVTPQLSFVGWKISAISGGLYNFISTCCCNWCRSSFCERQQKIEPELLSTVERWMH